MTQPTKPTAETVENPEAATTLVGSDLIEEVSIDGMCGVY